MPKSKSQRRAYEATLKTDSQKMDQIRIHHMMRFITGTAAGALALRGLEHLIRSSHDQKTGVDEISFACTEDQWNIAISRYCPKGESRKHPVVLCHGMGANRFTFDMRADLSLAQYLSEHGFDTYVIELRGHGLSEHPKRGSGKGYGWSFDDYLNHDIPTAIRYIQENTNSETVHYLGHSMGGLLLYSFLAKGGSEHLQSGITVGSSLDYSTSGSDFEALSRLIGITNHIPYLPLASLATLTSPISGRVDSPIDRFSAWPTNIEPEIFRRCAAINFHNISSGVLQQLTTVFSPGGLRSEDGNRRYSDGLHRAHAPMLALAGDEDRQCPPEAAEKTFSQLGSDKKSFRVFGPGNGDVDHYGHEDLLLGKRSRTEVFPVILNWFIQNDGTQPAHAA
jgi:alpha-beta hydrolase superfamily lysophospholipase